MPNDRDNHKLLRLNLLWKSPFTFFGSSSSTLMIFATISWQILSLLAANSWSLSFFVFSAYSIISLKLFWFCDRTFASSASFSLRYCSTLSLASV